MFRRVSHFTNAYTDGSEPIDKFNSGCGISAASGTDVADSDGRPSAPIGNEAVRPCRCEFSPVPTSTYSALPSRDQCEGHQPLRIKLGAPPPTGARNAPAIPPSIGRSTLTHLPSGATAWNSTLRASSTRTLEPQSDFMQFTKVA